jgi:hypothetical protein
VLGQAGYGQPQQWSPHDISENKERNLTYFDAVSRIINLLPLAGVLPTWFLRMSFMPEVLRNLGEAVVEYPALTNALLDQEKLIEKESGEGRDNLLAMMTRMSDGAGKDSRSSGLTPAEIQGNLFLVCPFFPSPSFR